MYLKEELNVLNESKRKVKDLTVITNGDITAIVSKKDIENQKLCECYNEYGQEIGCYDAGCWVEGGKGVEDEDWAEDPKEVHIEVEALTYHDGRNYRSIILGTDYSTWDYAREEKKILKDFENIEEPLPNEYNHGIAKVKGKNYTFMFSRMSDSSYAVCFVV